MSVKTYGLLSLAALGLVSALAACGDDEKKTGGGDATVATDSTSDSATNTNTNTTPDATPDTTTPTCDKTGITVVKQSLEWSEEDDTTFYSGETDGDAVDAILIQFYPPVEGGGGSPLTGPGTYPIGATEEDQNFATCETCVLILEDCGEEGCAKIYFATAGSINVTALDQAGLVMKGTLTNATLVEVEIDDETNVSTPVSGGDTWCLPNFAFDSTPECTKNEDCKEAGKGFCDTDNLVCVGCLSSFDCSGATPVCEGTTLACVAQIDECTGDDGNEPDDGPTDANALTVGQAAQGSACTGTTEQELDWFTFTTAKEQTISATVTWENADASFVVFLVADASKEIVGVGSGNADTSDTQIFAIAPAGKYYAIVVPSDTSKVGAGKTAVPYTLTVTTKDPECTPTKACTDAAKPICDEELAKCVVCASSFDCSGATPACLFDDADVASCGKVDICTGDDASETDDGPTGATALTLDAAATAAKICGDKDTASAQESDWFKLTLAAKTSVTFAVAWEGEPDLDFEVFDDKGESLGDALTEQPEELTLDDLAAGTYYIQVLSYDGVETASIGYTIKASTATP